MPAFLIPDQYHQSVGCGALMLAARDPSAFERFAFEKSIGITSCGQEHNSSVASG